MDPVYIGTKLLHARPMTLGDYNAHQGWSPPTDQDPLSPGYLVEYIDGGKPNHPDHAGYISWSPQDVFEKHYRPTTSLSIGEAVAALKLGKRVARAGWNGKGLFVFMQVPATILPEIIPRMQSLPESVKVLLGQRDQPLFYANQLALVNADNQVSGWAPSVSDTLAEDWEILLGSH